MTYQAGLLVVAVTYIGHIVNVDHRCADALYRQIAEIGNFLRAVVDAEDIVARADLRRAGRQVYVLPVERVVNVLGGHALGMHAHGIGINHDQARPPAVRQWHGGTRNRHDLVAHQP